MATYKDYRPFIKGFNPENITEEGRELLLKSNINLKALRAKKNKKIEAEKIAIPADNVDIGAFYCSHPFTFVCKREHEEIKSKAYKKLLEIHKRKELVDRIFDDKIKKSIYDYMDYLNYMAFGTEEPKLAKDEDPYCGLTGEQLFSMALADAYKLCGRNKYHKI